MHSDVNEFMPRTSFEEPQVTTTLIANWHESPQPLRPFEPVLMGKLARVDSMALVRTGVDVLPDYEAVHDVLLFVHFFQTRLTVDVVVRLP